MTFTTEQVRRLYACAYAWRTADSEGETPLANVREQQAAEFDAWLAEHDRQVRAAALAGVTDVDHEARFLALSARFPVSPDVLARARAYRGEPLPLGHLFIGVAGHPDDDECTYRSDGSMLTYCGEPESAHAADEQEADRGPCTIGPCSAEDGHEGTCAEASGWADEQEVSDA